MTTAQDLADILTATTDAARQVIKISGPAIRAAIVAATIPVEPLEQ